MRGRNNARAVKSATVVIFEDPKRRVVRLLESLTTKTGTACTVAGPFGSNITWQALTHYGPLAPYGLL